MIPFTRRQSRVRVTDWSRTSFLIALMAAWLAGDATPARADLSDILHSEGFYEAPLDHSEFGNIALIKVEINGHPLRLILDSGAPETILSRSAAREVGLDGGTDIGSLDGLNGTADPHAERTTAQSFKINGVELSPSPIIVSDFRGPMRIGRTFFDGLLGWATLKRNNVVFGYNPKIFFFRPGAEPSRLLEEAFRADHYAELQFYPHGNAYYVPLNLNGTDARLKLDSGSPFTCVSTDFAQLHIPGERSQITSHGLYENSVEGIRSHGMDGNSIESHGVRPTTMAIGALKLPPSIIEESPAKAFNPSSHPGSEAYDGLLGFDLIGQFYAFLDFSNDRLYLHHAGN